MYDIYGLFRPTSSDSVNENLTDRSPYRTSMSNQYDDMRAAYEEMRKLPISVLQDVNVEAAVAPFIKGAQVLDLACGMGYYSEKFLEWGAKQVVGIDISKAMVDAASAASTNLDRLGFYVEDCSIPVQHKDGPFDILFGAWLLNYASDGEEKANMFRNASLNLKSGGHFVGITPPPTNDPRGHCKRALAARPAQYGDVIVTITKDVEGGVATHLDATMRSGKVEFDAYHLTKRVYECSAWDGGLEGALNWRPVDSPDIRRDVPESIHSASWGNYLTVPHFSTLVVAKD